MRRLALPAILVLACASTAAAQPAEEPKGVAFADVGYATTLDDEGLLGRGTALSLGAGWRVTPRLTIQAVFDRIPYYRNEAYLEFDGRVVMGGVEAAFQSSRPRVRPFMTVGVVFGNDRKLWTHKTQTGPAQFRVDSITEHEYSVAMTRLAGGLDIRVSERASIRTSLRWHGLLNTGNDLAAHNILTPTIGAAWRW
jgi:hypothetical protein